MVGSISDFLAIYSEFRTLEESKVASSLQSAELYCPPKWGKYRKQGVYLITAHRLTMEWLQKGAVASTAIAQAKGSASGNTMKSDSWLEGSVYGQEYIQLRKSLPMTTGFAI